MTFIRAINIVMALQMKIVYGEKKAFNVPGT